MDGVVESELKTWDVPVDWLLPNPANPNEQDDETFNGLVEAIEEEGFVDPLQVVWVSPERLSVRGLSDDHDWFDIVGGEHRWRAAKVLGLPTVPCTLLDPEKFDEDRQAWNLVKLNVLNGQLNPVKFSRLFNDLKKRYDDEVLKSLMGFTTDDAFRRMYVEVRAALPPELQAALDEAKEELRTIDDLSIVLNRLFAEYGETLPSNMMVFSFGGKEVLWVRCSSELWDGASAMAKVVAEEKGDMSAELERAVALWRDER